MKKFNKGTITAVGVVVTGVIAAGLVMNLASNVALISEAKRGFKE